MSDTLHEEPQKDGFTHETPIRAFTTFSVDGLYAIGKGFRPSLQHLMPYLNAMEKKEGWRLVQILEAFTQTPSFVFRRDPPVVYRSIREWREIDRMRDPIMPELRLKIATGLRLVTADMRSDKGGIIDEWADRVDGHAAELEAGLEPWPSAPERDFDNKMVEAFARAVYDPYKVFAEDADDPVNPKHYGGTACAEIGELLTANSYQVLKYNWRLGEKDDEKVELGKALWYLDRELTLHATVALPPRHLPEYGWFDERLRHATPHAQAVARILISWNRYGNYHSLRGLRKNLKRMLADLIAKDTGAALDMGRGQEP